jgi:hypothetical protein
MIDGVDAFDRSDVAVENILVVVVLGLDHLVAQRTTSHVRTRASQSETRQQFWNTSVDLAPVGTHEFGRLVELARANPRSTAGSLEKVQGTGQGTP